MLKYLKASGFQPVLAFLSLTMLVLLALTFSGCAKETSVLYERTAQGAKQGTYYQVFVRAFADSDGDGIGDFNGLTAKLDYLNDGDDRTTKDLGVTGIWLMPIHPSPSYHGYDVTDYRAINPEYGTMEEFKTFLAEAKERDIAVIVDLVVNHTSTEHPWFISSAAGDPEYRNWFTWATPDDQRYNLGTQVWGHDVWHLRDSYLYYAIFWGGMPDLNFNEPAVRREMKDIATFWLEMGVDGFRLDAVPHIFGSGELPDHEFGFEKSLAWWKEFSEHSKSINPDVFLVGEVLDRMGTRLPFAAGLDSLFHFDMGEAIANAVRTGFSRNDYLASLFEGELASYREVNPNFVNSPFLSNHDQNRIYGLVGAKPENMKLAASMYLLNEGIPFVYYGEEIGMFGSKPDEDIRLPFLWGEDTFQTAWRESRYKNVVPLSEQINDPNSIQTHYRRLIQLRAALPALHSGSLSAVHANIPEIVAWKLSDATQSALVFHNLSDTAQAIPAGSLQDVTNAMDSSEQWYIAFNQSIEISELVKHDFSASELIIPAKSSMVLVNTLEDVNE